MEKTRYRINGPTTEARKKSAGVFLPTGYTHTHTHTHTHTRTHARTHAPIHTHTHTNTHAHTKTHTPTHPPTHTHTHTHTQSLMKGTDRQRADENRPKPTNGGRKRGEKGGGRGEEKAVEGNRPSVITPWQRGHVQSGVR